MSPQFVAVVVLVCILIGLSKGGLGGPMPPMLTTTLLSQFMPVSHAVSLALPLLMIGDAFALWAYWRKWDMSYIRVMLPAAAVGVVIGLFLLAHLDNATLRPLLGTFTLFFVIYKIASDQIKTIEYHPRQWHSVVVGSATGLSSAVANAGAPPWTIYMLLRRVPPRTFVGTTTLMFASINLMKLPGTIVAGLLDFHLLASIIWCVPLVPAGVWIGRRFVHRVDPVFFERLMLVLLFTVSLFLILVPS
jgi:uncharacterized membrane protein YfcA